jgi:hypothetical protein
MLDTLLDQFLTEWRVIREAPRSFVVSVMFASVLIFFAVDWHYGGEIGTRDATIKLQDERLSDYRTKLNGASPSEAASQIAALKTQLDSVQKYTQEHEVHEWLTINADKIPSVLAMLTTAGPHSLSVACNDDDCEKLADQVQTLAKKANWNPQIISGSIAGVGNGLALYGPGKLRTTTDQIGKAFQDAIGFPVVTGTTGGVVSDEFLFIIGRKHHSALEQK